MLAFADVLDLFAYELACLGRGRQMFRSAFFARSIVFFRAWSLLSGGSVRLTNEQERCHGGTASGSLRVGTVIAPG